MNARDTKNLPGRKKVTYKRVQWLMKLHTYGLLRNSFPAITGDSHDADLLEAAQRSRPKCRSTYLLRMQKALTQMNVQLANVLSDISGVTGQAIIKAILAGERDPHKLAQLRDRRVKASQEQIARYLEGNWQEDLLFVLKQEQEAYEFCQQQIAECDRQLAQYLQQREDRSQGAPLPEENRKGRRKKKRANKPQFDLREGVVSHLTGTDLTRIDSIDVMTAMTVLSEAGWDMSKWKTEDHFVSWLRLCPDNRISGNKVIGKGRLPTNNPITIAFKMAASTLRLSKTYLGAQFRRFRTRLGAPLSRDQGHGGQAGQIGLPHAALRDEIRRPRSGLLRASTPAITGQAAQVEGRQAGIPNRPSHGRLKRRVSEESDTALTVNKFYGATQITNDSLSPA